MGVESRVVATTSDGYILALYIIGFTARPKVQQSKNCYAQSTQLRALRKRISDHVTKSIKASTLQDTVKKFMQELPAAELPKACLDIFPLRDVFIRKVKLVKAPKFDLGKLMDAHGGKLPQSR